MKWICALALALSGCTLGEQYHETPQNKALRLQNEATVRQYWIARGINPDG